MTKRMTILTLTDVFQSSCMKMKYELTYECRVLCIVPMYSIIKVDKCQFNENIHILLIDCMKTISICNAIERSYFVMFSEFIMVV